MYRLSRSYIILQYTECIQYLECVLPQDRRYKPLSHTERRNSQPHWGSLSGEKPRERAQIGSSGHPMQDRCQASVR